MEITNTRIRDSGKPRSTVTMVSNDPIPVYEFSGIDGFYVDLKAYNLHMAKQEQTIQTLREVLLHQVYRNHNYAHTGCAGCEQTKRMLDQTREAT